MCQLFYFRWVILSIFLLPATEGRAQNQELNLGIYNTLLGGVIGGVGAAINKKESPSEENWSRRFGRGLWQGCIGGLLTYSGKQTASLITTKQNLVFGLPSKILHSAGASIIENAGMNRPFLKHWNLDVGLIRLDAELGAKTKIQARLLPVGFYGLALSQHNSRFDLKTSLLTGQIVFQYMGAEIPARTGGKYGMAYLRGFTYVNNSSKYQIIAHEIIHLYQHKEYQALNAWPQRYFGKVNKSIKQIFQKWIFFDVPYWYPFYYIEGYHDQSRYFRNFFEFEAERLSSNKFVLVQ